MIRFAGRLTLAVAALGPGRDACAAASLLPAVFFAGLLSDFFLPPTDFFAEGFAAAFLRGAALPDFFAGFLLTFLVDFCPAAFFPVDFFAADFFGVAGFFRTTDFFLDAFFGDDFLVLNLCLLPDVFVLAAGLRDAAFFLPVPACFCFLLAAFFAGIFHSCRSGKNAELYIGCSNMEAQFQGFFRLLPAIFQSLARCKTLRASAPRCAEFHFGEQSGGMWQVPESNSGLCFLHTL
ncbi:MAG: hypothetical protein WD795_10085 [Woeseia sp.]